MEIKKEKRELIKTIRLTQTELKIITKKAQNLQMNFSEYLIYSATNQKLKSKKQPLYKELITHIARTGNNLNQIAKICNIEKAINKHIINNLILTIAELQTELKSVTNKLNKANNDM